MAITIFPFTKQTHPSVSALSPPDGTYTGCHTLTWANMELLVHVSICVTTTSAMAWLPMRNRRVLSQSSMNFCRAPMIVSVDCAAPTWLQVWPQPSLHVSTGDKCEAVIDFPHPNHNCMIQQCPQVQTQRTVWQWIFLWSPQCTHNGLTAGAVPSLN